MSIHLPREDFLTVIRKLGLSDGLKLCLDAGHEASLPAASTKWLDLSGNGYDFFRGTTIGAEASDPTINGTPGRRSSGEYLSSDGGDSLLYDAVNETWMNNLHKSTGKAGIAAWVFVPTSPMANSIFLFSTCNSIAGSQHGMIFVPSRSSDGLSVFQVLNASGTYVHDTAFANTAAIQNSWNFYGFAWDFSLAGVSNLTWCVNTTRRTITSAAPTGAYSGTNASQTMRIGTQQAGSPLPNGARLGQIAMWESVRPDLGSFAALFEATRGKYGV
jgi:hypothetical protein